MYSDMWIFGTLISSIALIVFTIVKLKIHPFLALLFSSFFVGSVMGMNPVEMISAIEHGGWRHFRLPRHSHRPRGQY